MPGISANLRNFAFVGHPSSGKTTLVDALAHVLGASPRKGSVADKSSICDTEPEEQEKGHTLQAAVVTTEHDGKLWTLIDTPGYPEFVAETEASMFAADTVVGVVSATSGVTFNLRTKLETAAALGRGRVLILTHIDGENADFDTLVEDIRGALGEVCVPVYLPNESGGGFSGVRIALEDETSDWGKRLKDRVMDACEDEEALTAYLETGALEEEQLLSLLPHAIARGSVVPILACNPEGGAGLEKVAHFLGKFGPSGAETAFTDKSGDPITQGEGELLGVVFSVKADAHVGRVCTARILQGEMDAHATIHGTDDAKPEKLGGLFRSQGGKKREPIEHATAGEIVSFSKVEHVGVGDSFGKAGVDVRSVEVPKRPIPMVSLAVVPKSRADEQKIGEALHKLCAEDSSFVIEHTSDTHELVMSGMSDMHLQVMEARLKRRYGVEIETHIPKIIYQETVTKAAEGHHRHKKQSGGRGQFGECYMRVRPGATGSGLQFLDKVVGGSIPRNLIPAVEKGVREICGAGVLTHGHVVDLEVELYDGKFHAVDSDEASFKSAGARAFRDAFAKAGPVLLEPVMELEIRVPTECAGTIFSDVTSHRRGHVVDQASEADGAITVIKAHAPLSQVQTYHRDLKSQTSGEGTYAMSFHEFQRVPAAEQKKLMEMLNRQHDDD